MLKMAKNGPSFRFAEFGVVGYGRSPFRSMLAILERFKRYLWIAWMHFCWF